MRRSQSTLLMTVLVVLGLFLVSQLPAISNVSTTDPNLAKGDEIPQIDTDDDKIPDQHEERYSEDVVFFSTEEV